MLYHRYSIKLSPGVNPAIARAGSAECPAVLPVLLQPAPGHSVFGVESSGCDWLNEIGLLDPTGGRSFSSESHDR